MSRIGKFSGGIPRIINVICDNVLIAGSTVRPKIDEQIAEKTIRELGYLQPQPPANPRANDRPGFLLPLRKGLVGFKSIIDFPGFQWAAEKKFPFDHRHLDVLFFGWGCFISSIGRRRTNFWGKKRRPLRGARRQDRIRKTRRKYLFPGKTVL